MLCSVHSNQSIKIASFHCNCRLCISFGTDNFFKTNNILTTKKYRYRDGPFSHLSKTIIKPSEKSKIYSILKWLVKVQSFIYAQHSRRARILCNAILFFKHLSAASNKCVITLQNISFENLALWSTNHYIYILCSLQYKISNRAQKKLEKSFPIIN